MWSEILKLGHERRIVKRFWSVKLGWTYEPSFAKIIVSLSYVNVCILNRGSSRWPISDQVLSLNLKPFSHWRFWVIEIRIADWRGHNHTPNWSCLIGLELWLKIINVKKALSNLPSWSISNETSNKKCWQRRWSDCVMWNPFNIISKKILWITTNKI